MCEARKRRLSTFWMAVALIVVASSLTLWTLVSGSHDNGAVFLGIVLPWSIIARFPGAWIGARIGLVARHAVGWFAGFVGAGIAILLLNIASRPESFARDYGDGLGAAAWIGGLMAALIAEISTSTIERLRT